MYFKIKSCTYRTYKKQLPTPPQSSCVFDCIVENKLEEKSHLRKEKSYFYVYIWFTEVLYIYINEEMSRDTPRLHLCIRRLYRPVASYIPACEHQEFPKNPRISQIKFHGFSFTAVDVL